MYIRHVDRRTVRVVHGLHLVEQNENHYCLHDENGDKYYLSFEKEDLIYYPNPEEKINLTTNKPKTGLLSRYVNHQFDCTVKNNGLRMTFRNQNDELVEIKLNHSQSFMVDLKSLAKVDSNIENIYKEINEYFQSLPMHHQQQIFDSMNTLFEMVTDGPIVKSDLIDTVNQMYRYIDYEAIKQNLINDDNIIHPETKDRYTHEEPDNGFTYISSDYMELAAYAIYLRPLGIIWAYQMDFTLITDENPYKELTIYRMCQRFDVFTLPVKQRLDRYVYAMAGDNKAGVHNLYKAIGTDDIPDLLMSYTLLRRLAFFEFSLRSEKKNKVNTNNLISNIYNYLISKILDVTNIFGTNYRTKSMKGRNGEDGNTASFGSNYKIVDRVSEGTLAFYDRAAVDLEQYRNIEPSIDVEELYQRYCDNYTSFIREELDLENYLLVQYMLDDIIPMYIITSMNTGLAPDTYKAENRVTDPCFSKPAPGKETIMLFTATQYILELWELNDLAALVFAKSNDIPHNRTYDNVKNRLDPNLEKVLNERWPVLSNKSKNPVNEAISTIELLSVTWGSKIWIPRPYKNSEITMKSVTNGYLIQRDIRNDLAKLLIKLDTL